MSLLRLYSRGGRAIAYPARLAQTQFALRPLARTTAANTAKYALNISRQKSDLHSNSNQPAKMSFSNTDTGSKPADPYVAKNTEDPSTKEKIEDLIEFAERSKFCMMTTKIASSGQLGSRCMADAGKEGNGIDLIFHANTESAKTDDLAANPDVSLAFLNSSGEWASISGKATVETDRALVHKHYSPALKAWVGDLGDGKHDGGPDDPRICAIKVTATSAQYAVSKRTTIGGLIEVAKGVVTGETASVHKLRHIDESELQQYRSSSL